MKPVSSMSRARETLYRRRVPASKRGGPVRHGRASVSRRTFAASLGRGAAPEAVCRGAKNMLRRNAALRRPRGRQASAANSPGFRRRPPRRLSTKGRTRNEPPLRRKVEALSRAEKAGLLLEERTVAVAARGGLAALRSSGDVARPSPGFGAENGAARKFAPPHAADRIVARRERFAYARLSEVTGTLYGTVLFRTRRHSWRGRCHAWRRRCRYRAGSSAGPPSRPPDRRPCPAHGRTGPADG